MESLKGHEMLR